jgi:hypothetical protein
MPGWAECTKNPGGLRGIRATNQRLICQFALGDGEGEERKVGEKEKRRKRK